MLISALKSLKTSGGLGNLYVDDWKENGRRIETNTLHLVFCNFQSSDRGLTRFKK